MVCYSAGVNSHRISTGFQISDLSANGIQEESLYFFEDSMYVGAGQLSEIELEQENSRLQTF